MSGEKFWIDMFTERGALWIHDDNPKRPHALLTSGKHSNGFFNSSVIISNPMLLEMACRELLNKMGLMGKFKGMVFGSAMGAVVIAYEIARQTYCTYGFTEPMLQDGQKSMLCKRFSIRKNTTIAVVEDVITTGGTTKLTIAELNKMGAKIYKKIGVLVNRSGSRKLDGLEVLSLIERELPIWDPNDCPLCKVGSEALRPKGNWDLLTRKYKTD